MVAVAAPSALHSLVRASSWFVCPAWLRCGPCRGFCSFMNGLQGLPYHVELVDVGRFC